MPALDNAQHEAYAAARARGARKGAAALEAGYAQAGAGARASGLEKRPEVQARIAELRQQADKVIAKRQAVDRQWVMSELAGNVERAKTAGDHSAVNRGLELLGKEMGMFVDRKMDVKSPLESLSVNELKALAAMYASRNQPGGPIIDVDVQDSVPKLGHGSQSDEAAET